VRVNICSFNVSLIILLFDNAEDCVRVDKDKSSRGKFSVPTKVDDGLDGNGKDDGGKIARLFDDDGGSDNLNVERIIDTEQ
jgi:hypothetical protein